MITVANESIDLEEMFCRNIRDAFALRVRGDSLIQDHLCDGDIIVMERREHAHDGEMAVVTFETGESTVRRYYREGDKVRLEPGGRLAEASECKVMGVVIGAVRKF